MTPETIQHTQSDADAVCCPTCGQLKPVTMNLDQVIKVARMTRLEAHFCRLLMSRKGEFANSNDIASSLYADRIDGGPLSACSGIKGIAFSVRNKTPATANFAIESKTGPSGGWRFVLKQPETRDAV